MNTFDRGRQTAWILLAALTASGAAAWAQDSKPRDGEPPKQAPAAEPQPGAVLVPRVRGLARPDFWLGIQIESVPDALRAHVDVPAGEGLYVGEVLPGGPAAAAGLKQHDILLALDGKPLKEPAELAEAVEASQGKPLGVKLLRAGKTQSVEITPAKRTVEVRIGEREKETALRTVADALRTVESARDEARRQVKVLRDNGQIVARVEDPAGGPIRMRLFRQGLMLRTGADAQPPLAEDMSVIVTKSGSAPAKIEVHKGSDSWTVKEDELDKLPPGVREPVQGMLAPPIVAAFAVETAPRPEAEKGAEKRAESAPPVATPARRKTVDLDRRLEKDLGEVERQLRSLREHLDQLRAQRRGRQGDADDEPSQRPAKRLNRAVIEDEDDDD